MNKVFRVACIFLSFLFTSVAVDSVFAYSVYLKPQSIVSSESVLLKDIARIEGSERAGLKTVFANNSKIRKLSAEELRQALSKDPQFTGVYGSSTVILPLKEELKQKEIQTFIEKYIESLEGGTEFLSNHSIEITGFKNIKTGPGVSFQPDIRSIRQLRPGRRILSLDIVDDSGRILYRQKVDLSIQLLTEVPVATRELKSGERLTEKDYRLEKKSVYEKPANIRKGSLVMTSIQKGDVLKSPEVQNIHDIRRGQSIELVYQKGSVVVKVRAIADESGNIGQMIRVRTGLSNPAANRQTREARIVSNEIAVIE